MHIVIFTGGEAPAPNLAKEYFDVSQKHELVIVADSGLDTLDLYNTYYNEFFFKPNYILGDMDSIANKNLLQKYSSASFEQFPTDKDYTDTELALHTACTLKKADKDIITLVGGGGGRADHFLAIYDTFSSEEHADIWLCGNQKICFLKKGSAISITNVSLKDTISLARTDDSRTQGSVVSSGLVWESNVFRKKGMPSLSNRIAPSYAQHRKPIEMNISEGNFLLILPITAKTEITNLRK